MLEKFDAYTATVVTSTISGLLVLVVQHIYRRLKDKGFSKQVVVFEPREGIFNEDFYAYFERCLARAKTEVVISGEGFEYKVSNTPKIADAYHGAMRAALDRGVNIVRIQTNPVMHKLWADKLKELVVAYPRSFTLFIVDSKEYQDITSMCAIDAESQSSVVEIMLTEEKDLGREMTRVTSSGLFIHRKRELAVAVRRSILALKACRLTSQISNAESIDRFVKIY